MATGNTSAGTAYEQTAYSGMQPDGDTTDTVGRTGKKDPMLSAANMKDYRQLNDWWIQARTVQARNRYEQAIDDDFYDGLQWREEDQLIVEGRGQAALVFNQIKPVIDWIIGTQRRLKFDWHVYPRTDDDRKPAETKTKLMKYTDDVSHAQFHRGRAFADTVKVGIGWLEDGVRADRSDEPIYTRRESWRNIWYDHLAVEPDLSDARYLFRSKWVDTDIAVAFFPNAAGRIRAAAMSHDLFGGTDDDEAFISQLYYVSNEQGRPYPYRSHVDDALGIINNRRDRVRLVEAWYRKPMRRKVVRHHDPSAPDFADFDGHYFNPTTHGAAVEQGIASVYDAIKLEVWCAIFIEGSLLTNMRSPYRHDRFPFTPIWGYRRGRDGTCYGSIRNQRDPQEDMNKRRSKALHILSTKYVIAEEDAVADVDEVRDEVAAPDGFIVVRKNKRFEIHQDTAVAAEHLKMEEMNRVYIRETGGVNSENLGQQTNASSGKAIQARQEEGSVVTTELFENLRYALQLQGEIRLSLIEQFMKLPKIIRLTSDKGAQSFLTINDIKGMDELGQPIVENDITRSKADFVVDLQDYRQSVRAAMFDQLFEMVGNLLKMGPQGAELAINMLDLVMDMWDGPGKDELVARIRKLNGQPDPAMEGTPEAKAAQQAKEQADAVRMQKAQEAADAATALTKAKTADALSGAALKEQQAAAQAVDTITIAGQIGQQLAVTPQLASLIDAIMAFAKTQVGPAPAPQPMAA